MEILNKIGATLKSAINLPQLKIYNTWRTLEQCTDKVYADDILRIMTSNKAPIKFTENLDLSNYQDVQISGNGRVTFELIEDLNNSTDGTLDPAFSMPPSIQMAPNSFASIDRSIYLEDSVDVEDSLLIIESGFIIDPGSTLSIGNGSVLKINKNATLLVKNGGKLELKEGAKVLIEEGAYYCFEANAVVETSNGGILEINDNARNGVHPGINYTSNCSPQSDVPVASFRMLSLDCGVGNNDFNGNASDNFITHTWTVKDLETEIETTSNSINGNPPVTFNFTTDGFEPGYNFQAGKEYEITLTGINGIITSSFSEMYRIEPFATLIDQHTICEGDSTELDAGIDNVSYSWSPNNDILNNKL